MRHSGNETQHSTHFLVRSGTAQTNPTDSTFKLNSLCEISILGELQLALHRNVLQRETLYSDTSVPVLYYFDLRKQVESVLLLLPESILGKHVSKNGRNLFLLELSLFILITICLFPINSKYVLSCGANSSSLLCSNRRRNNKQL